MKINKIKILTLLAKEPLISTDISKKLGIQIDSMYVYLNKLLKDNKVERITNKKPYKYRAKTPLRYLIDLHSIMEQRMDFKERPNDQEIEIIKIVERLIQ